MINDLGTILTRISEQLQNLDLRLLELEMDAAEDRARRIAADTELRYLLLANDNELAEKIRADDLEKFEHNLSNSADIQSLQRDLSDLERRILNPQHIHGWRQIVVKRLDALAARVEEVAARRPAVLGFVMGNPPIVIQEGDGDQ
jgi:hypothetical protein